MATVLQLEWVLERRPVASDLPGLRIRNFRSDQDIGPWLGLYHAAFSDRRVRPWDAGDFHRQVVARRGWRPDWMWLAETASRDDARPTLAGSACLILRGRHPAARPVVHWLAVHPRWRRQGIASQLIGRLAARAWDEGYRCLRAETLSAWDDAAAFYRSTGFSPIRTV